jgi:hypothetical protein
VSGGPSRPGGGTAFIRTTPAAPGVPSPGPAGGGGGGSSATGSPSAMAAGSSLVGLAPAKVTYGASGVPGHPQPADQGAISAAAALSLMRPQGPSPGGTRMVQSARPVTRSGLEIDPSVWKNKINVQLERPPSRQKPPPEALHLWPADRQMLGAGMGVGGGAQLEPSMPVTMQQGGGVPHGSGVRARPQTAMATAGYSRQPGGLGSRGPVVAAAAAGGPGMNGGHVIMRPPTRQKPPPMSLVLEHAEQEGSEGGAQTRGASSSAWGQAAMHTHAGSGIGRGMRASYTSGGTMGASGFPGSLPVQGSSEHLGLGRGIISDDSDGSGSDI